MAEGAPPPLDHPPLGCAGLMARFHDWILPPEKATPVFDDAGNELPRWRDKGVLALLLFVLLLELVAWHYADGYPVADSVEFMERARTFVRGERIIDSGQIRPFGFSLLIAPIYILADWVGLVDPRPVLWTICLLQIACGLLLVHVCVRLGARLGGRRTGLVAGFLVGTNPAFLTYCAMPISGIFAAVCIGHGLESLWERGNARREWIGALWLAASVLMIYQCALIVATIAACILLRDRRQGLRALRTIALALLLALALQILLDRLVYGSFGASLGAYLAMKGGGLLSSICMRLGRWTHVQFLKDWSLAIAGAAFENVPSVPSSGELRSAQAFGWYFAHLPQMLVWPVLLLLVAALWKALRRPNWLASFAWLVFGANLLVMTFNPSKDFRLWLPLLPCVAPLCAWGGRFGWSALGERVRENAFWRRGFTLGMAGSSALLALTPFLQQNRREYGGYWQAIDWVNGIAARSYGVRAAQAQRTLEGAPPPRVRVACDYNWAVFQRESPLLELVKLPSQMSLWNSKSLTRARKQELLSVLPDFDLLVLHRPVLTTNPDLCEWISLHFQVCGALFDRNTYERSLGPILVLSRRRGTADENLLFEIEHEARPEGLAQGVSFARPDGSEELDLLGFEYRTLPPEGLGWISYQWYSPTGLRTHWTLLDRLTAPDEHDAWQNNHAPAWGTLASERWPARTRVSEGYLVVPAADPFDFEKPYRPLGAGYRGGDLIPLRLWMRIVRYDEGALERGIPSVLESLAPRLRSPKDPLTPNGDGTSQSPDGTQWGGDSMLHIGNFFIPVPPASRLGEDP